MKPLQNIPNQPSIKTISPLLRPNYCYTVIGLEGQSHFRGQNRSRRTNVLRRIGLVGQSHFKKICPYIFHILNLRLKYFLRQIALERQSPSQTLSFQTDYSVCDLSKNMSVENSSALLRPKNIIFILIIIFGREVWKIIAEIFLNLI